MRKLLFGTSALVAAGLLQADPAFAQAKESPVVLTVGGRFHTFYVFTDNRESQLSGGGVRDHGLLREAEIAFRGRTTLNNGLRAGVVVRLEAETCADQIDESWIWFEHDAYGRAEIGSTDQVGYKMFYGAPVVIPNFEFSEINMRAYNNGGGVAAGVAVPQGLINIGNDAEHINYFTPRFFGFQVGVAYTPENCQENNTAGFTGSGGQAATCTGALGLPSDKNAGQQGDIVNVALNFTQKYGDVTVGAYGSYSRGDLEAPTATIVKDQEQWAFGGQVGAYGFAFGAHYKWDNQAARSAAYQSWAAALTYKWAEWTVGLGYGIASAENVGAAGRGLGNHDSTQQWQLGVQYSGIGPGINLWGGVLKFDQHNGDNSGTCNGGFCSMDSNDGYSLVLGTTITY
jgi:hypothetical protein